MRTQPFFYLILFLASFFMAAQERPDIEKELSKNSELKIAVAQKDTVPGFTTSPKAANSKKEKPPVTDYKIISVDRDTTYVDTSLTIKKEYRFNYLRKDTFELLRFSNTGQTYNRLSLAPVSNSIFPSMGFSAKQFPYTTADEVMYYEVPTPFTEMFYKTVMEQGQTTDILFTTNTSPRYNFSISFKGIRSLGKYQHVLTSGGQFRFTSNYRSPNERYFLRFHYENQRSDQEENGGLTAESVDDFESEDKEFDERSKLSVEYEDADNGFNSKRYFLDHFYKLTPKNDTLSRFPLSLGHRFEYQSKTNFFSHTVAYAPYGDLVAEATTVSDRTELRTTENSFYGRLDSNLLGQFEAKWTQYNYKYSIVDTLVTANQFNKHIEANESALSGSWRKKIANIQLQASFSRSLVGIRGGDRFSVAAEVPISQKIVLKAGMNRSVQHPGFLFERYQSDYTSFDWQLDPKNIRTTQLYAWANIPYVGKLSGSLSNIENHSYFEKTPSGDPTVQSLLVNPAQADASIRHLQLSWSQEFRFWRFALDNRVMYQNVAQDTAALNVPEIVTRNTFYYSDRLFEGRMFLQTGVTLNYFTKYYMNGYHPIIGEFYSQNDTQYGGFPLIDIFVNAKVRQTRLYLKAEHLNSGFTGNTFYSAPGYPYRDYIIRFGLVWNFFM
jgi:hypothetical protein